jgi:hypothetical protein
MYRRILYLAGIIPLLSSCPDERFREVEYTITESDRVAIQEGIGAFFERNLNVELTTARARHTTMTPQYITVCGSFVLRDINRQPADGQAHLFGGILGDAKAGRRTFDVSSLERPREKGAGAPVAGKPPAHRLHTIICPE